MAQYHGSSRSSKDSDSDASSKIDIEADLQKGEYVQEEKFKITIHHPNKVYIGGGLPARFNRPQPTTTTDGATTTDGPQADDGALAATAANGNTTVHVQGPITLDPFVTRCILENRPEIFLDIEKCMKKTAAADVADGGQSVVTEATCGCGTGGAARSHLTRTVRDDDDTFTTFNAEIDEGETTVEVTKYRRVDPSLKATSRRNNEWCKGVCQGYASATKFLVTSVCLIICFSLVYTLCIHVSNKGY